MKTVNSLSGGRTSSYIAVHFPADYEVFSLVCIDDPACAPKDPAIIKFVNDKLSKFTDQYGEFIATAEDDATIVAMMDLEQIIGREIIWLRGKSFDAIIDEGTYTRLPGRLSRYCTQRMKIGPIFDWWFNNIGKMVDMRIGFRFDEFDRMQRFFNNSDPTTNRVPVRCSLLGQKRQYHEDFKWRFCSFPLIKHAITEEMVLDYWKHNGHTPVTLFTPSKKIEFPVVSNCVGCFHKKATTIATMCNMHPEKMAWFARQEEKEMGTWYDSGIKYSTIAQNSFGYIPEMIQGERGCDSEGCTA